jgi:hypothetical protein
MRPMATSCPGPGSTLDQMGEHSLLRPLLGFRMSYQAIYLDIADASINVANTTSGGEFKSAYDHQAKL